MMQGILIFDIYANSTDPDSGYFVAYTAAKTMKAFVQFSIFLIWNFLLLRAKYQISAINNYKVFVF